MSNYTNINEINDNDYQNENNPDNQKKEKAKNEKIEKEDLDEQYNLLFSSTIDINSIKNEKPNTMKSSDLNLDKELAQSKININKIEKKDFLISRKWQYSDDNNKKEIENKIKRIYKEMNKNQLESLESQIKKCNLQLFYNNFNPRELKNRIGALSSLNFLIEATYYSSPNSVNMMIEDKQKLEPYVFKFRNIMGDGDCFYRGLIFYFLENIVLTNNIMLMKELLIIYDEKINLNNPLIEKKEYLKNIKILNISIVSQILYYLICEMEKKDINHTYNILLKVFLYCQDFDFGIIYFTRYLIYEYISLNENKIYSQENQINIGCFLPEDFVEDKGDLNNYFFESYYLLQLMKPKTFAEKIVIYIAPFVFNCNINILIYDYGANSFIQEKNFTNEKKSEFEINLIFRKAHYDIFYKKPYYDKYSKYLDLLPNISENICFLNIENQKELEDKINAAKKQKNNKETNLENYEYMFDEQGGNNKDALPKCMECKKTYDHKENVFGLCNNCLLNDLKTQILTSYIYYRQNSREMMGFGENIYSFLKKQKFTISMYKDIELSRALYNSGYKLDDLFLEIRKSICLYCSLNIENEEFFIELPCHCRLCKKECFGSYCKEIENRLEIYRDETNNEIGFISLNCYCGFNYDLNALFYMIKKMEEKKLKEPKEVYQKFVKRYWKWKCMMCGANFNPQKKYFRVIFKDDKIDKKLLKKTDFYHLICHDCACENQINKVKEINCNFCKSKHTITDYMALDESNETESDCIII